MKAGAGADLPAADYFLRHWVPRFSEGVIEEVRKVGLGRVGQAGCQMGAEAHVECLLSPHASIAYTSVVDEVPGNEGLGCSHEACLEQSQLERHRLFAV